MITEIITGLIETYETSNPYKLCHELDIKLNYIDLGCNIGGFLQRTKEGYEMIHINTYLPEPYQTYVLAHELGHAICHPEISLSYFQTNMSFIRNKYELEADKFAVKLLLLTKDIDLVELQELTLDQIAATLELPSALLKRLKFFNLL